jgi:hypothetical protein
LRELESLIAQRARDYGMTVARYRDTLNRKILLTTLEIAHQMNRLESYAVKGGAAIELRFGVKARATKDIDIDLPAPLERLPEMFSNALAVGCGDFSFTLKPGIRKIRDDAVHVLVGMSYAGVPWATVDVDLAPAIPGDVLENVALSAEDFVQLAGTARSIRLERLIAQKIHAATRPEDEGYKYDYARHVVDVLFLTQAGMVDAAELRAACEALFEERGLRGGHAWPPAGLLPERWIREYDATLQGYGLEMRAENVPKAFLQLIADLGVGEK